MWLSGLAIVKILLLHLACFKKEEGCLSQDMNSGSDCFCEEHLKRVRHLCLEKKFTVLKVSELAAILGHQLFLSKRVPGSWVLEKHIALRATTGMRHCTGQDCAFPWGQLEQRKESWEKCQAITSIYDLPTALLQKAICCFTKQTQEWLHITDWAHDHFLHTSSFSIKVNFFSSYETNLPLLPEVSFLPGFYSR